jgi:hypothetical protein
MVNPLYPRTVAIHRQKTDGQSSSGTQQVGLQGYSGRQQNTNVSAGETVLYTGLPASISPRAAGKIKYGALPADFTEKPQWAVTIPFFALPQYSIRDADIIVDDEGYRYGVTQNVWTVLGYQLAVVRLEA